MILRPLDDDSIPELKCLAVIQKLTSMTAAMPVSISKRTRTTYLSGALISNQRRRC
jgi:hypothetical protein